MVLSVVEALKGSLGHQVRELAEAHGATLLRTGVLECDLQKTRSELSEEISAVRL